MGSILNKLLLSYQYKNYHTSYFPPIMSLRTKKILLAKFYWLIIYILLYQDSNYSDKSTLISSLVSDYSFGDPSLRLTFKFEWIKNQLYTTILNQRTCKGTPSRFPGKKVQMAGSEPLIQEADPRITKLAIETRM